MKIILSLLSTVILCTLALSQPPATTAPSPQSVAKAKGLLVENEKAMLALKTYSAECWTTTQTNNGKMEYRLATLTAAKPEQIRYDAWDMVKKESKFIKKSETPKSTLACDGQTLYRQDENTCRSLKLADSGELFMWPEPWNGFYTAKGSLRDYFVAVESVQYVGRQTVEETLCDVIRFKYYTTISGESNGIVSEIRADNEGYLYFGPDKLVRRQIITTVNQVSSGEKKGPSIRNTKDSVVRKIRTNFPAPPVSAFTYTLPEGVTLQEAKRLPD